MEKVYIKRENKKKNDQNEIRIENDFLGLYNYLTAPNIRNKIKHPLFLAIKFSEAFEIYYMSNILSQLDQSNDFFEIQKLKVIIQKLQELLNKDTLEYQNTGYSELQIQEISKQNQKNFYFNITGYKASDSNDLFYFKKIQDMMDIIQDQNMQLLVEHNEEPAINKLQKLDINQELIKNYTYIFQNLIEKCTL